MHVRVLVCGCGIGSRIDYIMVDRELFTATQTSATPLYGGDEIAPNYSSGAALQVRFPALLGFLPPSKL